MQRILTSVRLDEKRVRTRVRIEGDPCELDMIEPHKQVLLRNIADDPSLLQCGLAPFQSLRMYHDTNKWIVEVEAIVESPNEQHHSASAEARGATS